VDDDFEFFEAITNTICTGGFTPLHIAAAGGCAEMCRWFLQFSDDLNQNSQLGTPIHCTLFGLPDLIAHFNSAVWLHRQAEIQFNVKGRPEVLKILIQGGSDLAVAFTDHHGTEFPCSMLALYANMKKSRDHPLISLVAAGCKLDQALLTSFEEKLDTGFVEESLMGEERYDEFLDGLVGALEASSDDQDIKADLLNLALRSRTSRALQLIRGRGKAESSNLESEKVHDLFYRAIRFDQIEVVEDLLRSGQADLSFMFYGDNSTPLHIAVESNSINSTRLFLSMGASVEAITSKGRTPLHVAVGSSTRDSGCILALVGCVPKSRKS
jgi:ankyrin repeat protein